MPIGFITGATCGDGCWYAREDVCHCSCGGANHGCLRSKDGQQPIRTARIDGRMCELKAVGFDLDEQAREINKGTPGIGIYWKYAHTQRQSFGYDPIAKMRIATKAQVEKWPELKAYRQVLTFEEWRKANPDRHMWDYSKRPYLLWVIKEPTQ